MGLYIRKFSKASVSLGPSEERGFGLWAGYELVGIEEDLSALGFTNVSSWTTHQLAQHGIVAFTTVDGSDRQLVERLGLTEIFQSKRSLR